MSWALTKNCSNPAIKCDNLSFQDHNHKSLYFRSILTVFLNNYLIFILMQCLVVIIHYFCPYSHLSVLVFVHTHTCRYSRLSIVRCPYSSVHTRVSILRCPYSGVHTGVSILGCRRWGCRRSGCPLSDLLRWKVIPCCGHLLILNTKEVSYMDPCGRVSALNWG